MDTCCQEPAQDRVLNPFLQKCLFFVCGTKAGGGGSVSHLQMHQLLMALCVRFLSECVLEPLLPGWSILWSEFSLIFPSSVGMLSQHHFNDFKTVFEGLERW